mgnify:CR=1 FL=1
MKHQSNLPIQFEGGSPAFWLVICAAILLAAVFVYRQAVYMPVSADTVKDFVLDESKEKASPIKKYFPKPYSVKDLQRGDYDRH